MKTHKKSYPVPPDSVYVWRGYKSSPDFEKFYSFLGSVFVPCCALLQPPVGLRAYLPTLVQQTNKPYAVPDQTALMFWDTPQSHDLANETVAVRAYQNLHGDVYDMTRSHLPEVPLPLPAQAQDVKAEQPYYLFAQSADWMLGSTRHLIAARPSDIDATTFTQAIYNWSKTLQLKTPDGVDASLVCCGTDYVVIWVHSSLGAMNWDGMFAALHATIQTHAEMTIPRVELQGGLWNDWAGIDYSNPDNYALNIQLKRPENTVPQKP